MLAKSRVEEWVRVFVATLTRLSRAALIALTAVLSWGSALAAPSCPAERAEPLVPADDALCEQLEAAVRKPSALPHDQYEAKLAAFLRNFCHRREASGWKSDKHMRDTGPFVGAFHNGKWIGEYHGTHAPAVVWYSPDMVAWLKTNRAEGDEDQPASEAPVPDGAIMVKEMFPPPTSHCKDAELLHLFPENGAAIMVRDAKASYDGWFWGWFGWGEGDLGADLASQLVERLPQHRLRPLLHQLPLRRRATTRPSPRCATSRASRASRLSFLSQDFYLEDHFDTGDRRLGQRSGASVPRPAFHTHHEDVATEEVEVESANHGRQPPPAQPQTLWPRVHRDLPAVERRTIVGQIGRPSCRRRLTTMCGSRPASRRPTRASSPPINASAATAPAAPACNST